MKANLEASALARLFPHRGGSDQSDRRSCSGVSSLGCSITDSRLKEATQLTITYLKFTPFLGTAMFEGDRSKQTSTDSQGLAAPLLHAR